jgi:hypothetical protein
MQPAVVNLTVEDMIALSTYVGTLDAE